MKIGLCSWLSFWDKCYKSL